jgi:SAM-dependent methyltransferase
MQPPFLGEEELEEQDRESDPGAGISSPPPAGAAAEDPLARLPSAPVERDEEEADTDPRFRLPEPPKASVKPPPPVPSERPPDMEAEPAKAEGPDEAEPAEESGPAGAESAEGDDGERPAAVDESAGPVESDTEPAGSAASAGDDLEEKGEGEPPGEEPETTGEAEPREEPSTDGRQLEATTGVVVLGRAKVVGVSSEPEPVVPAGAREPSPDGEPAAEEAAEIEVEKEEEALPAGAPAATAETPGKVVEGGAEVPVEVEDGVEVGEEQASGYQDFDQPIELDVSEEKEAGEAEEIDLSEMEKAVPAPPVRPTPVPPPPAEAGSTGAQHLPPPSPPDGKARRMSGAPPPPPNNVAQQIPSPPQRGSAAQGQVATAKGEAQAEAARSEKQLESRPTPRTAKGPRPWWERFFTDDYLRSVVPPTMDQVKKQCDFVEASLGLPQGSTILDVGCGLGLHALELTGRGYLVVGLDLSLPMITRAAEQAQYRGLKINFLHADIRKIEFDGSFDGVICIGTTFGFFDEESNRDVLGRLRDALRPGGRLLIDVVNRDFVIRSQPNLIWFQGDSCVCMEESEFNYFTSRLHVKRTMMHEDGRQSDTEYSVRLYSLHELGFLMRQTGFRVLEVSGQEATRGVFFGLNAPRAVVLAERFAAQQTRADGGRVSQAPASGKASAKPEDFTEETTDVTETLSDDLVEE